MFKKGLISLLLIAAPVIAGTPAAPKNLCVSTGSGATSCSSSTTTTTSSSTLTKKWNPGHYVRANAVSFPDSEYARDRVYDFTKGNSNLKGGLITVPWGSLETSKGVYDFSQIDKDLAYLKSLGKKLIIEVWWQKYGGSVPDTRYFPQYIYDAGGVGAIDYLSEHHVMMDQQQWADRYVAMQAALAARYDSDPDVEQIVITETASTSSVLFKTIVPQVAQLWKKTNVVLYANWVDTGQLAQDLAAICNQYGVGLGGPDIMPPKSLGGVGEDHASRVLRGAGVQSFYSDGTNMQDFGSIDYRGKIPVSYSYENLNGMAPSILLPYATSTLKATHIVWSADDTLPATNNWSQGVLPLLQAAGYPIVTARPSSVK